MNLAANRVDLPTVPQQVIAFDGQKIRTDVPQWRMQVASDGGGILFVKWSQLDAIEVDGQPIFSRRARELVKLYLADRLTRRKVWSGIQANNFWIGFRDYDIGERPLLLLAVLLVILGVQFLVMGLIAELMVRTYYESQNKTVYYIRQVIGGDANS